MNQKTANKILLETEQGYDDISQKFSQTRKHFWRELESIKDFCVENDKVLDFGCGNGRLLDLLAEKKINYWGVDVSEKLVEIAKDRHQKDNVVFGKINPSQTSLAFEAGFFNTIYSIAVFHHFPSEKYRQEVASELFEKTKSGGRVVITVWYLWQKKYFKNILQNWKTKFFETFICMSSFRSAGSRHDSGAKNLDWNDCMISFTDNEGRKFQRFHHAFTKRELKKLFKNAGFEIEKCEIVEGRNIMLVGKKKE
ncbi:MAG: methyltransferase domain-containing protein [Candidatus Moranbacteria bacterium]|nr:methyltransferase domain-containing protein [Candidatus Moranbacteria bacterium]